MSKLEKAAVEVDAENPEWFSRIHDMSDEDILDACKNKLSILAKCILSKPGLLKSYLGNKSKEDALNDLEVLCKAMGADLAEQHLKQSIVERIPEDLNKYIKSTNNFYSLPIIIAHATEEQVKQCLNGSYGGSSILSILVLNEPNALTPFLNVIKNNYPATLPDLLLNINNDDNTVLIHALHNPNAFNTILEAIENSPSEKMADLLLKTNWHGKTALMIAAQYYPRAVVPILKVMKAKAHEKMADLLLKTNRHGYTALMFAAVYHPEATVAPILMAMKENFSEKMAELLLKTNIGNGSGDNAFGGGYTALMAAAARHPEAVTHILKAMQENATKQQMADLLLKTSWYDETALMIAAGNYPEAVASILKAMQENATKQQMADLLLKTDSGYDGEGGDTALMTAAAKHPKAVVHILEVMKAEAPEQMTDLLLKANWHGDTALMIAAVHQPAAVAHILEAMKANAPEKMFELLIKKNRNDDTALILAALYELKSVAPILEAIKRLAPKQALKLLPWPVSSFSGYNPLIANQDIFQEYSSVYKMKKAELEIENKLKTLKSLKQCPDLYNELSDAFKIYQQSQRTPEDINTLKDTFSEKIEPALKTIKPNYQVSELLKGLLRCVLALVFLPYGIWKLAEKAKNPQKNTFFVSDRQIVERMEESAMDLANTVNTP